MLLCVPMQITSMMQQSPIVVINRILSWLLFAHYNAYVGQSKGKACQMIRAAQDMSKQLI